MDYIFIYTTFPTQEDAQRVARAIIKKKLAGCANVFPQGISYFQWEGEVKETGETIVILKSRSDYWERLREAILSMHPYEVPVIAKIVMQDSNPPFQQWMDESLRKAH